MEKIYVKTSKEYCVTVASDLSEFGKSVLPCVKSEKVGIITDSNVAKIYPDALTPYFSGKTVKTYVVPAGEKNKNAKNYLELLNSLAEDGFTREDTVVTFGGGMVGDLGAFVASTYMRGITLVAVPTTVLAAVDSSVGGKTAINLEKGKNLCGTFYQPDAVFISTEFFKTLPVEEYQSGMGEIVKYSYLTKGVDLKNGVTESVIFACLSYKAQIVEVDEREANGRKLLNLGHTFGHAIERLSGFEIPHGVCVAKGIYFAIKVSKKHFGLSEEKVLELLEKLKVANVDFTGNYAVSDVIAEMMNDKKRKGEYLSLILFSKDGKPCICDMKTDEVRRYLDEYRN